MEITVRIVEQFEQNYDTAGDYGRDENGNIWFKVTKQKTEFVEKMILIHEMIEELLVTEAGIKDDDIVNFDKSYTGDCEEPGDSKDAPYNRQHTIAKIVERIICNELNIDFQGYMNSIL